MRDFFFCWRGVGDEVDAFFVMAEGSGFGLGASAMRSTRILGLLGCKPGLLLPKRAFICEC